MSDDIVDTEVKDKVMYYPNGIHDYFTVTMLAKYPGRLVPGNYYAFCYLHHGGYFVAELNEAMTTEQALEHQRVMVNSFMPGNIVQVHLMKVISGSDRDYIVQWHPFEHTIPIAMTFEEGNQHTTSIIH